MTGARTISIDVKLYAALLRLEGAAMAIARADKMYVLDSARPALLAALEDLRKLRGVSEARARR